MADRRIFCSQRRFGSLSSQTVALARVPCFKFVWIDAQLRRRYSAPVVGVLCSLSVSVVLVVGHTPAVVSESAFAGIEWHLLAVIAIASGIAAMLSVRTWLKLWRKGRDKYEVIVYDLSVRFGGPIMASFIVIFIFPAPASDMAFRVLVLPLYIGLSLVCVALPLGLGCGFLSGKMFAAVIGVRRTPGLVDDDLPMVGTEDASTDVGSHTS